MALNFPASPVDGQVYPNPAPPGATQYVYNADKGTWLTVFRGGERVTGNAPIFVTGEQSNPAVNISPATQTSAGSMSAADKTKLDNFNPTAGVTRVTTGTGLGAPATGDSITDTGTINLLAPTPLAIGGVKAGNNVTIAADGTLTLKAPSSTIIGGVKQGAGVSISADGTISATPGFTTLDNISNQFNGSLTQFQMTVSGVPFAPPNINALLVFVGGVIQPPLVGFTITGSSIIFTSAPPAGVTFYGISLT
jgi:hypothetical protein